MPRVGSTIETARGEARVVSVNVPQESITVRLGDDTLFTFTMEEIEPVEGQPSSEAAARNRGGHRRRK
jgi:hypothetical protein